MINITIGYFKYKNYIITIELENYKDLWTGITKPILIDNDEIKRYGLNKNNIGYLTKKFKVICIEDILGNLFDKIDLFCINEIKKYDDYIIFYKSKDVAFFCNFMNNKEYLLFKDGYSGIFRTYNWNGEISNEYYIVNNNKIII